MCNSSEAILLYYYTTILMYLFVEGTCVSRPLEQAYPRCRSSPDEIICDSSCSIHSASSHASPRTLNAVSGCVYKFHPQGTDGSPLEDQHPYCYSSPLIGRLLHISADTTSSTDVAQNDDLVNEIKRFVKFFYWYQQKDKKRCACYL